MGHASLARVLISATALLHPCFAAAQSGDKPNEIQNPPPAHLQSPPAPPLTAEEALKTFRVAPGFRVEIVASDPLVFDPVAMTFGPDGRIWVVEMRAYMPNVDGAGEDAPIGSIAVLEDTNADGRMDRRTEFAGGFVLPRALALVGDGLLVAEPPNLWFLRDTNGDSKADQRTLVANDYGTPSNPEHSANGLMWALDNWIYSANHTARFRYDNGTWRHEPTTFRGQWGITQDDYGRLYYNNNSEALRTDVIPAEYVRRNPNLPAPRSINVQLAKAEDIAVWPGRITTGVNRGYKILREDGTLPILTAASGPVIYRGTLFPASFRGNAFICEPAGNLIKRLLLEERAGVPEVRNAYASSEFMTSTDERFRPVNLFNGPDGALYVVDMYRGVIQHRIFLTTYLRNQIKERGLEAPVGMGRIYRIVPQNLTRTLSLQPSLSRASVATLVATLSSEHAWQRDTAQRLLVERRDAAAIPALRKVAMTAPSELARIHALWTLDGMQAIDWPTLVRALADTEAQVAIAAMRIAEPFLVRDAEKTLPTLRARAYWSEPEVLRQFALSLGSAPPALADPELVRLAVYSDASAFMPEAIVSSVTGRELAFVEALEREAAATKNPGPFATVVELAAAAVLQSRDVEKTNTLLARLHPARQASPWMRAALLQSIDRLIPRDADGTARPAFVASEPAALIALAATNGAEGQRAAELLKHLRWRGQAAASGQSLADLDARQRASFERGRIEYAVCASCHQPQGEGMSGLAPALVGSKWANGSVDALVRIVLNGKSNGALTMPSLRSLDDETLAAILTFVRRSWGHEATPVSATQVQAVRNVVGARDEPWSDEELEPFR